MKKNKQLKTVLTLLTGGIFIASSFAGISATSQHAPSITYNSKKSDYQLLINKIKNATSITEMAEGNFLNYRVYKKIDENNLESKKQIIKNGSNRLEIVFKAGVEKSKINQYVESLKKLLEKNHQYIYGEHTLTFSIAFEDIDDLKQSFLNIVELQINFNDLLQVNIFDTKYPVQEWQKINSSIALDFDYFDPLPWCCRSYEDMHPPAPEPKPEPEPVYTPPPAPPKPVYKRWDMDEDKVWNNYYNQNRLRYEFAGLNPLTLRDERVNAKKAWEQEKRVKVGVLEYGGLVRKDAIIYSSDDIHVEEGPISLHANEVAEIIIGQQGINPYASLYSDWLQGWNGHKGAIERLVSKGVTIINNSWEEGDLSKEIEYTSYNDNAIWLDNFINANPEVVFIKAAGNRGRGDDYYKKNGVYYKYATPGKIAKYLDSYSLSYNSIIVGALKLDDNIEANDYSEHSAWINYVTTSAPDLFISQYASRYLTDEERKDGESDRKIGTSFAAPTITAIASLLKTNYSEYFDRGYDSIIMKSALISGSRSRLYWETKFFPNLTFKEHKVYNDQAGFGRVNFEKVKESLEHLDYFTLRSENTENNPRKKTLDLVKGDIYRINLTWLNIDPFQKPVIYFPLRNGPEPTEEHVGPIPVKLNIIDPSNKKMEAYTEWSSWQQANKVNTLTFEFKVAESGTYNFDIFQNGGDRKDNFDVAMTYSKI
ncbi:S8 family serine peptidase [Mycoplasmopsis agassizii]|uniref:S8 family serine peptidase n=2 Tax=Mycoplasmopsis agassizii TaxID=33922 RepID=UPI003529359A